MKTSLLRKLLLSFIFFPLLLTANTFADQEVKKESSKKKQIEIPEYARVFSTESTFFDVKSDLLEAITSQGLVISYISHAKTMLDNTAAVSGVTKSVYSDAEIYLFCKADLSHKLVAGNPHNIVLCPYSIAIYSLNDEPERVYLSYRTVASSNEKIKALTKPIEDLLIEIIEEVI